MSSGKKRMKRIYESRFVITVCNFYQTTYFSSFPSIKCTESRARERVCALTGRVLYYSWTVCSCKDIMRWKKTDAKYVRTSDKGREWVQRNTRTLRCQRPCWWSHFRSLYCVQVPHWKRNWMRNEWSFVWLSHRRAIVVVGNVYLNFLVCLPNCIPLEASGVDGSHTHRLNRKRSQYWSNSFITMPESLTCGLCSCTISWTNSRSPDAICTVTSFGFYSLFSLYLISNSLSIFPLPLTLSLFRFGGMSTCAFFSAQLFAMQSTQTNTQYTFYLSLCVGTKQPTSLFIIHKLNTK